MPIERVRRVDRLASIRHVLVSVSDKSGLGSFIPDLIRINPDVRIYSTGGTFAEIESILGTGDPHLKSISSYTGHPEMSGGLVKTLDYKIYLGILSETYNENHRKDVSKASAVEFDMVVANLYPFAAAVEQSPSDFENARGNVDIGGPAMVRAAAKNFLRVVVVTRPEEYPTVLAEIERVGGVSFDTRFELARIAYEHTAAYDSAVASYFASISPRDATRAYSFEDFR